MARIPGALKHMALNLAQLDGSTGFRLDGINGGDYSGTSVAGAGDVNGDGIDVRTLDRVDLAKDNGAGSDRDPDFDDLSIVAIDGIAVAPGVSVTLASGLRVTFLGGTEVRFDAPGVAPGRVLSAGLVYEISDGRGGSASATVTVDFTQSALSLDQIDGSNGFRLIGSGWAVSGAGDVNGDGLDDVIVGWPFGFDYEGAGASFVVFGSRDGFGSTLELTALDGGNGFRLQSALDSQYGNGAGISVAGGGDINGDGLDDMIVGAFRAGSNSAGASFVVFGAASGFPEILQLDSLDGQNGFRLDGVDAGDEAGRSVAFAGDINGDGLDDLVVGAPNAGFGGEAKAGESYVVFGTAFGFDARIDLATLNGSNGFRVEGTLVDDSSTYDYSGVSVAGAGDVNGDGISDLLIGAPGAGNGHAYVVFGSTNPFDPALSLSSLDGSNGFRLQAYGDERIGWSVAGAGDVNGDGIDDVIVGSSYASLSYLVFGSTDDFAPALSTDQIDGTNGCRLIGAGSAVAGGGDFNGDGIDDLIVGNPKATPNGNYDAGASYVVLGRSGGFGASLDLKTLDGSDGFRLDGIMVDHASGYSVSFAGDVNGDGFDDVMIGAAGESYVVFGYATDPARTPVFGTPCPDILVGTDDSEAFHPGGGWDRVTTGGGEDLVFFDDRVGRQDVLKVTDFDPLADALDLQGASVRATIERCDRTVLLLGGPDCDRIVLLGLHESPFDLG